MTRYADPSVCPGCRAPLPPDPAECPSCGLPLRGPLVVSLFRTLTTADELLTKLRASGAGVPERSVPPQGVPGTVVPEAAPPRRTGVSGPSVASILLGLGALCLLVAAVTFLAVAWSWLGVGGRTGVLVALTVTAAAVGQLLAGRGQRLAAEALTLVALGLLALDVVGAGNAGWLGELGRAGTTCVVGGAVLAGSAGMLLLPARLLAPQVVAVVALAVVLVGAAGLTSHDQVVLVAGVAAYAALAALGRAADAARLPLLALVGAGLTWFLQLQLGLADAADHASLRGLWASGHGAGLLVASVLPLLPVPLVTRSRPGLARVGVAVSACLLSLTAALPATDEGATRLAVVALVLLLLWSGVAAVAPLTWRLPTFAPLALSAGPVAVVGLGLLGEAAGRALAVGEAFTRPAGVRLAPVGDVADPAVLVPCVLGLLVAAVVVTRQPVRDRWPAGVAVVAVAGVATLALYPVPLGLVTTAASLVAIGLVVAALLRDDLTGSAAGAAGGLAALGAVALALPNATLTTVASGVLVLLAAAVAGLGRFPYARPVAWGVLPVASAGLLWSVAEATGVDEAYRAAPVLVVAGLLAIWRARPEVELSAALTVVTVPAALDAAADPTTSLALHLTLLGALVTASALVHPSRRPLGWLGGALLAAATWVRLADLGVHAPEAYTLPIAAALLVVGLFRLRRDPGASTLTALAPGLSLATVPSLLWVLSGDAVSLRALLLGIACLVLVLTGARLRWNAPLVVGAGVGALLVLRELAPYAAQTPQWVGIGLAGLLLTVVGVTWEQRMLQVRHATAYLGRLR